VIRIVVEDAVAIFGVFECNDIDLPGDRGNEQSDTIKILLYVRQVPGTDEPTRSQVEFVPANSQINQRAFASTAELKNAFVKKQAILVNTGPGPPTRPSSRPLSRLIKTLTLSPGTASALRMYRCNKQPLDGDDSPSRM
jgi:hypothetical protein